MLEILRAKNFQCHEEIRIEFDPYLTCLIGKTNAGKSAILRLLRWVMLNQPSGDAFITHGKSFCRARLKIDGHMITRTRGRGNTYKLNGETFKAFGQGVPEPIANLVNVGEENYQSQFAPLWWFGLPPGQVSRELNSVVNLAAIDDVLSAIANEVRQARAEAGVCKQRLSEAREKRDSLKWVEGLKVKLDKLEKLDMTLAQSRLESRRIASLVADAKSYTDALQRGSRGKITRLNAIRAGERVQQCGERVRTLEKAIIAVTQAEGELSQARNASQRASKKFSEALKAMRTCPVCERTMRA